MTRRELQTLRRHAHLADEFPDWKFTFGKIAWVGENEKFGLVLQFDSFESIPYEIAELYAVILEDLGYHNGVSELEKSGLNTFARAVKDSKWKIE